MANGLELIFKEILLLLFIESHFLFHLFALLLTCIIIVDALLIWFQWEVRNMLLQEAFDLLNRLRIGAAETGDLVVFGEEEESGVVFDVIVWPHIILCRVERRKHNVGPILLRPVCIDRPDVF